MTKPESTKGGQNRRFMKVDKGNGSRQSFDGDDKSSYTPQRWLACLKMFASKKPHLDFSLHLTICHRFRSRLGAGSTSTQTFKKGNCDAFCGQVYLPPEGQGGIPLMLGQLSRCRV